ncbi:CBS domain containing membrane protein [Methanosalsum zhilinae DSM 4017]|uniref:CBS domain containing membrane protein n=1 Tax=Methanosalsum zhilinae (strain DSM 4017 / NBRC 107636 / OCM 62 / WeN5) TaxID=679901 RepID=F7XMH7_METZD|nr:CBS domain-containing protein [Methanosalsum zhilinae]AEH59900.1 CBS domain containing membrane protein [Methanosalsum zhilinae DSM 4017]
MKVEDIMSSPVYVISPDEPLSHARNLMLKHKISTLVVIDEDEMVGIVSKSDMSRRLAQAGPLWRRRPIDRIPVNLVMRESPVTIYPEASITQAVELMIENDINNLPVVNNKVVGIITRTDIVGHISKLDLNINVSTIITGEAHMVHRHHTVNHVVDVMNKNNISRVIVMNNTGDAVGMISTTNLALNPMTDNEGKLSTKNIKMGRRPVAGGDKVYRYVKEVPLLAEDIMTEPLTTVNLNDKVVDAAQIMLEHDITGLPVEDDGEIVGILSRSDVIKVILDQKNE